MTRGDTGVTRTLLFSFSRLSARFVRGNYVILLIEASFHPARPFKKSSMQSSSLPSSLRSSKIAPKSTEVISVEFLRAAANLVWVVLQF